MTRQCWTSSVDNVGDSFPISNPGPGNGPKVFLKTLRSLPPVTRIQLAVSSMRHRLGHSQTSICHCTGASPSLLGPPCSPGGLGPRVHHSGSRPLRFHPRRIRQFTRRILKLGPIVRIRPPARALAASLLQRILRRLRTVHTLLRTRRKGGWRFLRAIFLRGKGTGV